MSNNRNLEGVDGGQYDIDMDMDMDLDLDLSSLSSVTGSPPISPYISRFDHRGPFEGSKSPSPMEDLESADFPADFPADSPGVPPTDSSAIDENSTVEEVSIIRHFPLESIIEEFEENNDGEHAISISSESDDEIAAPRQVRPLRLDNLPIEILKQILSYVFPVDETVAPWYRCGMRTNGRGISINDDGVTFEPNLDTKFLRLNKACNEVGTTILYSHNHFHFANRADCAKWFLSLIGDHNVKKLKSITLEMNSGWHSDRRDPSVEPSISEQSYEEDWARSIIKLYNVEVQLDYFEAITDSWLDPKDDGYDEEEDREELEHWRKVVVDRLAKIRNVKQAVIREQGAVWIGRYHAQIVQLMMQQQD